MIKIRDICLMDSRGNLLLDMHDKNIVLERDNMFVEVIYDGLSGRTHFIVPISNIESITYHEN